MDDDIDSLLIEVRANTQGFQSDIEALRGNFDATLVGGFEQAGGVLERGLLSAVRRGSLGFDDLKRSAFRAFDDIAAQALQAGIGSIFGGGQGGDGQGGVGGILGSLAGALLGLPGRATGGPVGPGSAYLVGERGPEVFVPTSAGRIETQAPGRQRDVRVAIQLTSPRGSDGPACAARPGRSRVRSGGRSKADPSATSWNER